LKIRFQEEQLWLFAAASLDRNPLHLSREYARTTPFGDRVVYGMLSFAACLGELGPPSGTVVSGFDAEFHAPLFLDVDYSLAVQRQTASEIAASLMDGSATAMTLRLRFREGAPELVELDEKGIASREAARRVGPADLHPGLSFRGSYAPPGQAYLALLASIGIDRQVWGDGLLLAAVCGSYLTGMELPGESAMLTGMTAELTARPELPGNFEITLDSYDERFQLLASCFELRGRVGAYVRGEVSAIARPPRNRNMYARPAKGNGRFNGKRALVIGASRGLGAALALELVAEGCTVVGTYLQSREDIQQLQEASGDLPGRLVIEQGDASDSDWCVGLKARILDRFGKLDLLICNAAPALQPLSLEPATYDRIQGFLHRGFALVGVPLSSFLQLVSSAEGKVLLISSAFVEEPPRNWPHYIALKAAAEGLMRAAAAGNPKVTFWVARPGRLRTDMSNTPSGWFEAEEPATVAHRIVQQVAKTVAPGEVHICS
jgi:NAD(P)-dependent dehydrogenase (short-subunit alcohol dehydrogenase family)/acyl dehydratase